jgi:NADH-quinone oxidoreductase subunit A
MLSQFGQIFIFFLLAVAFVVIAFIIVRFLAPSKPNKGKNSIYECGEESDGKTWVKFNIRYYVIALIFIIFDVEIIFLFPWAVVFKEMGMVAFLEMALFLLILIFGFIYVLIKGDLQWDRPQPIIPKLDRQIFKIGNQESIN